MRMFVAVAVLATVVAGAAPGFQAVAQTSPSSTETTPADASAGVPISGAIKFVTEQGTGEFRASKLVGLNVYGTDSQRVGDITELLLDDNGTVQAVVIGVGGFLGIGEKTVAVPFAALSWVNTRPPAVLSASTGVIGSAVTAVTGGVGAVRSATSEVTANAKSPAEIAAYNGYPDHAVLRLSKAELQTAPTFRYYAETHPQSAPNATAAPARK